MIRVSGRDDYFWLGIALAVSLWVPWRLVAEADLGSKDYVLELGLSLLVMAVLFDSRRQRAQTTDADGEHQKLFRIMRFADWMSIVAVIPAATLASLIFAHTSPWLLAIKLFLIPETFRIRPIVDSFDTVHPVTSRLLPMLVVAPIAVHLLACGWMHLGNGSMGPMEDKRVEYVQAVYWAITTLTTVGYGDITAKTPSQMIYAALSMILGVGFFGFILSNVASLLARLDAAREQYLDVLENVEAFMRYNHIPGATRSKVRAYFRHLWKSRKGLDSQSVLATLPQNLRAEVALSMNADIIRSVPIFDGLGQEFLADIASLLQPLVCMPGEKIFHAGEAGDAMYFIHRGDVDIVDAAGNVLASLGRSKFFGERALVKDFPRSASAITKTHCDLFQLKREDFIRVRSRYPGFDLKIKNHIAKIDHSVTVA